jgi:formylglycine-generating enzyme required for sulfatase activity
MIMKNTQIFKTLLIATLSTLYAVTLIAQPNKMIFVEGGTFMMGNPRTTGEYKGDTDEKPVHKVTVGTFYICENEVTVKQYKEYCTATGVKMPSEPDEEWLDSHLDTKKLYASSGKKWWGWNDLFPIHNVNWFSAVEYCNWLSHKENLEKCYTKNADGGWELDRTKNGYRLPTEAEWEFAARGGKKSMNYIFSGSNSLNEVAWYDETSLLSGPQKIKTKKPNELGIYDMSGNVWEWCSDYYKADYYSGSPEKDPFFSVSMSYRVIRGGSWHYSGDLATTTGRDGPEPAYTNFNYGFRLVRSKI